MGMAITNHMKCHSSTSDSDVWHHDGFDGYLYGANQLAPFFPVRRPLSPDC